MEKRTLCLIDLFINCINDAINKFSPNMPKTNRPNIIIKYTLKTVPSKNINYATKIKKENMTNALLAPILSMYIPPIIAKITFGIPLILFFIVIILNISYIYNQLILMKMITINAIEM